MKIKEYLLCCIYNLTMVGIFTFLSVTFNHWWIVLFSVLFFTFPKFIHRFYRVCDKCGKHSEYAATYDEAIHKAVSSGWEHNSSNNTDYCPICKKEVYKN